MKKILLALAFLLPINSFADSGLVIGPTDAYSVSEAVRYSNENPTPTTIGGIASGSTFVEQTMTQMWNALLYPYVAPSVSLLIDPTQGLREFGNPVASPDLTPTTTRGRDPITSLTLSRSGTGVIHTYGAPNPNGATEALYEDVSGSVTATTTYTATVGDGTSTGTATRTYTFVYPFYHGVGAQGLTAAQVAALTKDVSAAGDKVYNYSPTNQVMYAAWPVGYGTSPTFYDWNGFNFTADWTCRTENITGLDATAQSYRICEFDNLTTQVSKNVTIDF